MTSHKKCIGFVFRTHKPYSGGRYYEMFGCGSVRNKEDAHVFTCAEAQQAALDCPGWASKEEGKWRMRVQAAGKSYHLGYAEDLELAALILSEAREILHGEYANNG